MVVIVLVSVSIVVAVGLTVLIGRHPRTYVVPDRDPGYRETPRVPGPILGDLVSYLGPDEPELRLWQGHPGVVLHVQLDADGEVREYVVAFACGPEAITSPQDTQPISARAYADRGRRLAAGQHPLHDGDVELANRDWPSQGPRPRPRS